MIKFFFCSLIVGGIIFMVLGIRQSKSNRKLLSDFYIEDKLNVSLMRYHHILLYIFLSGYILVLIFFFLDKFHTSELITSGVFFLGAVFVFLENQLNHNSISVMKSNLDKTLRISSALEHERERLMSLNRQLVETEDVTIYALAYQAEIRDTITGNHILRTAKYVQLLVEDLMENSKYSKYITTEYKTEIVKSAPLHDIGKVGIPDKILQKEGTFTKEEFDIMKKHCLLGAQIIRKAIERLNFKSFLSIAEQMTLSHHEKWDGSGYPNGLIGENIPLSGRIMAVADVYDALRAKRQYKDPFSHKKACNIILEEKGTHFDPEIVSSFERVEDQFEQISIAFDNEDS
ncbi:HD-GYP domain-containing protein [Desulfobacter curvatus]|uniref:HD-GYP domain-containing protein n=1 Tax=Desulfobacter curvatus TaxID=2290 RepID=UPI000380A742|nr:HD domain-containing phosphohydrolase [Desulfobacter curvatus]